MPMLRWVVLLSACLSAAIVFVQPCQAQSSPAVKPTTAGASPVLDLPQASLAKLSPTEVKRVNEYIRYWANKLATGDDDSSGATILEARNKLVAAFSLYDSPDYRYNFVRESVAIAAPLVKNRIASKSSSGSLRETNLAIWLSALAGSREVFREEVWIKPALSEMVKSPEDSVRDLGWHGYSRIKLLILAQGQAAADELIALIKDRAAAEKSSVVLGAMMEALNFPLVATGATKEVLAKAQADALETLQSFWPRCCSLTAGGNEEMSGAMRNGVETLQVLAQTPAGRQNPATTLQMVVDAMYCAWLSYDNVAKAEGMLADANGLLMAQCEAALGAMTGRPNQYVLSPLTSTRIESSSQRRIDVGSGVFKWVEGLGSMGVTVPKYKSAGDATAAGGAAKPTSMSAGPKK